jgi:glycerol-3-phosphate O-acyltransferase
MPLSLAELEDWLNREKLDSKLTTLIREFYISYQQASAQSTQLNDHSERFKQWMICVLEAVRHPYPFPIFHQSIRQPFDYYQFGLDFIRPFIDFNRSRVIGLHHLQQIQSQLKKKENVFLFANHQTEPDPQIISLLLEKIDPQLAAEMIFIAGHRVISDPMTIPLSMGRHLLCIYSKKHMADPIEQKGQKILHNQRTIKKIEELLNEGGYCIYVAPSGGRDRRSASGKVEVSVFDPHSIELFWLLGQRAARPTHFYPLALRTYDLMPPPDQVEKELGEKRVIHVATVFLAFGKEIDMDHFLGSERLDKKVKQGRRADYIWNQVQRAYDEMN